MNYLLAALFLSVLTYAQNVGADVARFAVVIGNNVGLATDGPLRYAESDARRVQEALVDLGDFPPWQTVLLEGASANTVRSALLSTNERIRDATADGDKQVFLFVYYSGHADAQALHLGGSELPIAELRAMTRGSAAELRMLVLDACRSGALTQVKGGRRGPAFTLPRIQINLPTEGFAFLAASTAFEDAQESDLVGGSFFTHALVSGMLGAADANGDGAVVLDEAYTYAYHATLRATSRTLAGPQHPTFRYHLKGRGPWVLTRPGEHRHSRGVVRAPTGFDAFIMRGDDTGPVVAEVSRNARSRSLNLPQGRYFLRLRGADVLYEGSLELAAGMVKTIDAATLQRVDYARLARKGALISPRLSAHSLELDGNLRTPLPNAPGMCLGVGASYTLDLDALGVRSRLGFCEMSSHNAFVDLRTRMVGLELTLLQAWDLPWITFDLGVGAALNYFVQTFETAGLAPSRHTLAPTLVMASGAQVDLSGGIYARLSLAAETHMLRLDDATDGRAHTRMGLCLRTGLGVGKRF